MSGSAVRAAAADDAREEWPGGQGWLEWLRDRLDPAWRAGEWDGQALLFTGDLESPRTAAWPISSLCFLRLESHVGASRLGAPQI